MSSKNTDVATAHMKGSVLQILALIFLVVQNLIGPQLFGAETFGRTFFLLSFVFVLQGILESVFFTLTIQKLSNGKTDAPLGKMWRDGALFAIVFMLLVIIGLTRLGHTSELHYLVTIAVLQYATTVGMGIAYGMARMRTLFKGIATALAAFTVVLFWSAGAGQEDGMFLAFVAFQLAMLANLAIDPFVRESVARCRRFGADGPAAYGAAFLTRAPVLLLGNGLIIGAGMTLSFSAVAVMKVYLSMINAGRFLLPLSMPVLQSVAVRERASGQKATRFLLRGVGLGWVLLAAILFFISPWLVDTFVGLDSRVAPSLTTMFVAMPMYLMMQPLALASFSGDRRVPAFLGFVTAVIVGTVVLYTFGAVVAFVAASWVFSGILGIFVFVDSCSAADNGNRVN